MAVFTRPDHADGAGAFDQWFEKQLERFWGEGFGKGVLVLNLPDELFVFTFPCRPPAEHPPECDFSLFGNTRIDSRNVPVTCKGLPFSKPRHVEAAAAASDLLLAGSVFSFEKP